MNMMAIRLENFDQKNLDQSSAHSLFPSAVDCSLLWNTNGRKILPSQCDRKTSKLESLPQLYHNGKQLGLRSPDQESSTAQSIGQSLQKEGAADGQNVQEQCISSESGQDENCGESVENQMKPATFFSNHDMFNPPQVDSTLSMARVAYPYVVDPYSAGLYGAFGQQVSHQMGSNVVGMVPARVPLLGVADDGPIYVNAKQYHGILRRRQSRAKLEAQNKLIKNRKPYLHESRHLHAMKRMRGSGGRFLSAKNNQSSPDHTSFGRVHATGSRRMADASEFNTCNSESCGATAASCSEITSISGGSVTFRGPGGRFSVVSSGGFVHGGRQKHSSVVQ